MPDSALKKHRVFNNPDIITEGWYPVCPSSKLKPGQADSVKLTYQRILIYRSEGGDVAAMDAFCPHMGADLANGRVVGDRIECYFHQWQFGPDGTLADSGCARAPKNVKNHSWPVEEKYGYIPQPKLDNPVTPRRKKESPVQLRSLKRQLPHSLNHRGSGREFDSLGLHKGYQLYNINLYCDVVVAVLTRDVVQLVVCNPLLKSQSANKARTRSPLSKEQLIEAHPLEQ